MSKGIKYLIITVTLLCILIPGYFYIRFQMLPIYKIEYNAGEETIDWKTYVIHYVYFNNRTYKSVNPSYDYPLGKLIGKTENDGESVFTVKGNQELIAVRGFMSMPIYFKETKDSK